MAADLPLSPDFRDMLAELTAAGVDDLIVGGFAVAAHGHLRTTKAIDVFVRPSPDNARRVVRALLRFGAPLGGATAEDFAVPGTVFQIGVPPRRIDIVTAIEGVAFDQAASDPLVVEAGDLRVPVVGLEALIAYKLVVGRPRDLDDVEALRALQP